jgi:hypothetical protein
MSPRAGQYGRYELDALGVVGLSTRQTFERLAFWVRAVVWRFMYSLPLVTYPAATAAFYYTIREGLLDPVGMHVDVRQAFKHGFRIFFWKSLALATLNLSILAVILFSLVFWATQESWPLIFLAAIAAYFLIFWWMCQPFIVALMVESPVRSVLDVARGAVRLVAAHPVYSFLIALLMSMFYFIGLVLIGPGSMVIGPLLAIIATQALWVVTGQEIPDLVDPVEYADRLASKRMPAKKAGRRK